MSKLTLEELQKLVEKLGGDKEARKILFGKTETPVLEISGGLKPNGNVAVGPLAKAFVVKDFFRNDNRSVKLHIYDSFKNQVLSSTGKVSKQPAATLVSYDLTKPMCDREICAELPENHVFAIADFWMISDLISHQSKGESGALLNKGYSNLFYVQIGASVFVVSVFYPDSRWHVGGWDLDERAGWCGGTRVFSRNG